MPRLYSQNPDREIQRLRASGKARLPTDPFRAAVDRRELLRRGTTGSLDGDVRDFLSNLPPSEGRTMLNGGGFRGMDAKHLAGAGPEAIEAINQMHKQRTGQQHGGGMGNAQVAWPKLRDPFEQFREKAWWFLKEGDFSQSLKKIREWCQPQGSMVWMADGTFKSIEQIAVGEEVMGWEWHQAPAGRREWRKYMKPTKVVATQEREAPMIVEVGLESGRTVRATDDHRWANYYYTPAGKDETHSVEYKPAQLGMRMTWLVDPVEPLTEKKQIEAAAYLGGIIDGEGTVSHGSNVSVAQSPTKNPGICRRIEEALNVLGLPYTKMERTGVGSFGAPVTIWRINGGRAVLAKMRSWIPSEKVEKAWNYSRERRHNGAPEKVTSITELGPGTVYSMQTETGNYVSQGFGSSNCRLVYMTHPLVPSLIDIYSRFPLLDIEFKHRDQKLADFYNDLFLNQLDYQEFLFDMAREYWTVGEAFALGSWHDGIGAWDADELLNPDDVLVSRNSVLRQYQYHLKVPEGIKKLIETRQPREEYEMLVRFYPYILQWAQQNSEIPVSDVLLKQLKFKVNPWEPHGVPILMRAFKTMMLEMSLEAAQDAVADRLYSPLILANLGIEDVGDGEGPWIPEPEEIDALRDDLALALMSDFRMMVYHHGLTIQSVFGREVMPRFDMDFERVDMKLMQIFGIGPELLQGGKASAPYASGALNRELLTQMLGTYQVGVQKFLRERMEVVAERQGHFEFEKRGDQRFPVFETVLMQDELTGEEYIEEKPKLAVPEVSFRTMNLRDETVERQFLLELKQAGVPVADQSFMVNVPIEFDDEVMRIQKEKQDKVLGELHYQKRLFTAIFINHLPVPPEYAQAYMEFVSGIQGMALMMGGTDITSPAPAPNLFPELAPSEADQQNAMMAMGTEEGGEGGPPSRSAESDSGRAGAPRQAFRMYANATEQREFAKLAKTFEDNPDLAADMWIERFRNQVEATASIDEEDVDGSDASTSTAAILPVASGYEDLVPEWEKPESVPEEGLSETDSIRVAGIKSMASPAFYEGHRRKMAVPKGAKVSAATKEDIEWMEQRVAKAREEAERKAESEPDAEED